VLSEELPMGRGSNIAKKRLNDTMRNLFAIPHLLWAGVLESLCWGEQ
jgi:hypothetical protein